MVKEKEYWVYMLIFPNGKYYFGATTRNPEVRWDNGRGYQSGRIKEAIKEFSWENIEHKTHQCKSEEQMYEFEQALIAKYNTTDPQYGYNTSIGGKGGRNQGKDSHSDEYYREWQKKYYQANPEKIREKNQKWRQANPEKAKECVKNWQQAHPEKKREYNQRYQAKKKAQERENELTGKLF